MTAEMARRSLVLTLAAVAVVLGSQLQDAGAVEPAKTDVPQPSKKEVLFEDHFERDDLGEQYAVVNSDPNRMIISNSKLLIVATEPSKNLVLLQKTFPGEFVATVAVTMELTKDNHVALYYRIDERSFLSLGIAAADNCHRLPWEEKYPCKWEDGRRPFFSKVVEGQANSIVEPIKELGNRPLQGYSDKPETWYLQLQRMGSKYTGWVSVDGIRWARLGTHVIVQKYGQLGLGAGSGGGVENPAEFDNLVVQGSR